MGIWRIGIWSCYRHTRKSVLGFFIEQIEWISLSIYHLSIFNHLSIYLSIIFLLIYSFICVSLSAIYTSIYLSLCLYTAIRASLVAQRVKNLPATWETHV